MKREERSEARTGVAAQLARRATSWIGGLGVSFGERGGDLQLALVGVLCWALLQSYARHLVVTEWQDLIAVLSCLAFSWMLFLREPRPLPALGARFEALVIRAGAALLRVRDGLTDAFPRIGVDLVERPAFPRGLPRLLLIPGLTAVVAGLFFALRPFGDGQEIVRFSRHWAYPGYLVAVTSYWLLAAAVGVIGFLLPFALTWSWACSLYRDHDKRRRQASRRAMGAVALVMLTAAIFLPAYVAPLLATAAVLVPTMLLQHPHVPKLCILWRPRDRSAPHRSMDWRALVMLQDLVFLSVCLVLMTAPGLGLLSESQRELAPISTGLRWFVSIGGLFVAMTLGAQRIQFITTTGLAAPSRPKPRRIHIEGGTPATRALAKARLKLDGWKAFEENEDSVRADDMRLRLDPEREHESPHFVDLKEPIAPGMLQESEVLWRLKRRADIRSRRSVMKGLKAVFKEAAASLRGPGTGYVVAPHQWFMLGLSRDIADYDTTEDRSLEGFLHPEYRAVMTPRARHHLYLVLSSVGVDLIYVEDGVGYRRLIQALKVIFEFFDRHGVDRQIGDRDFAAVHGVHAILMNVTPDRPRESELYPEPDYASETRARILHLYRDRGGEDETVDAPVETDDIPLLV